MNATRSPNDKQNLEADSTPASQESSSFDLRDVSHLLEPRGKVFVVMLSEKAESTKLLFSGTFVLRLTCCLFILFCE